jgi:flagellin
MVQGLSILTNVGAAAGLERFNDLRTTLATNQQRITTGLRINGPKDDPATFAISQGLRGDIAGYKAVRGALATGAAITDVAIAAGKAISNLLIEIKASVVQANAASLDSSSRTSLDNDFQALRQQLQSIVATAEFNGVNLLSQSASAISVLATVEGSTTAVSTARMDTTTLGLATASLLQFSGAQSALTQVNSAIELVAERLATLGATSARIEAQNDVTLAHLDILIEGLSGMVDADMGEESARLTALRIQEQLGARALAIANNSPRQILELFPGAAF